MIHSNIEGIITQADDEKGKFYEMNVLKMAFFVNSKAFVCI